MKNSIVTLNTRVVMAPDGANFNPAYIDNTDSYAVIGNHKDVSTFLKNHMSAGEYEEHFSDWVGGVENPERSSKTVINKTNAIAIDAEGLAGCAGVFGVTNEEMGAFLVMHGAGHNATLGHADIIDSDIHRSNMRNSSIMASGNRIYQSVYPLDFFMKRENNSTYISIMNEKFGNNTATDNYNRNSNPNANNPYQYCPKY